MYDDYDFEYSYSNDYNLDDDAIGYESPQTLDLDEEYARDDQDYQSLAYRYYA